jgi:hypothetical protein
LGPIKRTKERERERERERWGGRSSSKWTWLKVGGYRTRVRQNESKFSDTGKEIQRPRLFAFDTAKCPFSMSWAAKVLRRFTTSRFFVSQLNIVRLLWVLRSILDLLVPGQPKKENIWPSILSQHCGCRSMLVIFPLSHGKAKSFEPFLVSFGGN